MERQPTTKVTKTIAPTSLTLSRMAVNSGKRLIGGVAFMLTLGMSTTYGAAVKPKQAAEPERYQPKSIPAPHAGAISGTLHSYDIGGERLAFGSFSLPLRIDVEEKFGRLIVGVFPQYSPDNASSSWGMGFAEMGVIRRINTKQEVQFDDSDELSTPWGKFILGNDGSYYSHGLKNRIRLRKDANRNLHAYLPDGSRAKFKPLVTGKDGLGFGWYVDYAQTKTGETNHFYWDSREASLPVLTKVLYGGRSVDSSLYQLTFAYTEVAEGRKIVSFASGQRLWRDRVIQKVAFASRLYQDHGFNGRWHYDFAHVRPEFHRAGHFLTRYQKVYASGAKEPAHTFRYDWLGDHLNHAEYKESKALTEISENIGSLALIPNKMAIFDYDRNGYSDFESSITGQIYLQSPDGSFTPFDHDIKKGPPVCTPYFGSTVNGRKIGRLYGRDSDLVNFVMYEDEINLCTLDGDLIETIDTNVPAVNFHKSALVDINRDGKLDVVAYHMLFYDLAKNTSRADKTSFTYKSIKLEQARSSSAAWFLDVNGDGHIDILGAGELGIEVFYGKGDFSFEQSPVTIPVRDIDLIDINKYGAYFADVNKDGLIDLYASRGSYIELFLNDGKELNAVGLRRIVANPDADRDKNLVVAGLGGSELANLVIWNAGVIKTLEVNRASTGLMIGADDGKGTVLEISYKRTSPDKASGREAIVVSSVAKQVVGRGTDTVSYGYANPQYLGLNHRFSGFKDATKQRGEQRSRYSFDSNDMAYATLLSRSTRNKVGILKKVARRYKVKSLAGINTYLPASIVHTTEIGGQAMSATVATDAWDDLLCPSSTRTIDQWGQLEKKVKYVRPTSLKDHLICLPTSITYSSKDGPYPLQWTDQTTYNSLGLVTAKARIGAGSTLALYSQSYDDLGRLKTASVPGQGEWNYSYYSYTPYLTSVIDNLGVAQAISGTDPKTGQPTELATSRSADHRHATQYRYDGFERLAGVFDGQSNILQQYSYVYPSQSKYGVVGKTSFYDGQSKSVALGLQAGDGSAVASLLMSGNQFQAGKISRHLFQDDQAEFWLSRPFSSLEEALDPRTLLTSANKLATHQRAKDGTTLASYAMVATGVQKDVAFSRAISGSSLITKETTNGKTTKTMQKDSKGRIMSFRDELGHLYQYSYDAAGRPRKVTLPSGGQQAMAYDAFGRLSSVTRAGIGTLYNRYDDLNQVSQQEFWDSTGKKAQVKRFGYDEQGRIQKVVYSDKVNPSVTYRYLYDGEGEEGEAIKGQNGFLTTVIGPKYRKTFTHDEAGRKASEHIAFFNGHNLERRYTYYRNDELKRVATRLLSNDGKILDSVSKAYRHSAEGKLVEVLVNDKWPFTIAYDDYGQVKSVTSSDFAAAFTPSYDQLTRGFDGSLFKLADEFLGYSMTRDRRGLISKEALSGRQESSEKSYTYDNRGHLIRSGSFSYQYNADGIMAQNQSLVHDSFGRLIKLENRQFSYGADGQLSEVKSGDSVAFYHYDENHQLLVRETADNTTYFYEGTRIMGERLVEDLEVAGFYLGYLDGGQFTPVFTDPRGTPTHPAYSPYGQRDQYGKHSEIIDFTRFGRDPISGLVRMGVRHYSPELGRFTTPDMLFLQSPTLCLENPVGCNLYSYGRNNPLSFTDPTGLCAQGGCGTGQYLRYTLRPLERAYHRLVKAMNTTATGVSKIYDSTSLVGVGVSAGVRYTSIAGGGSIGMSSKIGVGSKGLTAAIQNSVLGFRRGQFYGAKTSRGIKYGAASYGSEKFLRLGTANNYLEFRGDRVFSLKGANANDLLGGQLSNGKVNFMFDIDRSSDVLSASVGGKYRGIFQGSFGLEFGIDDRAQFERGLGNLLDGAREMPSDSILANDSLYLE